MHFDIILCYWAHLESCSLFWTHFRGAGPRQKRPSTDKNSIENKMPFILYMQCIRECEDRYSYTRD